MKKFNAFLTIIIAILSIASLVFSFINVVDFKSFDFQTAETIIVILCVSLAILFALVEKNYIAALIISLLKITIPFANGLLVNLVTIIENGSFNFTNDGYIAILNTLLFLLAIYTMFSLIKNKQYQVPRPKFKFFIWPFVLMLFYEIYRNPQDGFIIGLAELLALIFAAHVSESLLWIGAMVFIPLNLMQMILDKATFTTSAIIELVIGGVIFIMAIVMFIYNIIHRLGEKEERVGRIVE